MEGVQIQNDFGQKNVVLRRITFRIREINVRPYENVNTVIVALLI